MTINPPKIKTIYHSFLDQVVERIKRDQNVIGLAAAGSYITNDLDDYSDLDLVLVTHWQIAPDKDKMMAYANYLGNFISGFTGEHVGDPRLLICLYDNPLMHVDIKFLTEEEFKVRVEDPILIWDPTQRLKEIIATTKSEWPPLDFQWIEDRFWTFVHYAALKIGRGEYFGVLDFLSYLRTTIISPLLQIKNGQLPRGLRKAEFTFTKTDLKKLIETAPAYEPSSIFHSLEETIATYKELRKSVYPKSVIVNSQAETKVLTYLHQIKLKSRFD
jgi:predicted nucleotidyltransferase